MTPEAIEVIERVRAGEGLVELLGVDLGARTAILRSESKKKRPYTVQIVDLSHGKDAAWDASGVVEIDAQRLGRTLSGARLSNREFVPLSRGLPDGRTVYRLGNTLYVADARGVLHTVFEDSLLDHREHLSPDGSMVAWVREAGTAARFSLIAAPLTYDPDAVTAVDVEGKSLSGPLWAPDGNALFFSERHGDDLCVHKAERLPHLEEWSWWCAGPAIGGGIALSPDGASLAAVVEVTPSRFDLQWIRAADASVAASFPSAPINGKIPDMLLDDDGLLVAAGETGVSIIDFATGRHVELLDPIYGIRASDWVAPGVFIGLRPSGDLVDLVRVDARKLLAETP